MGHKVSGNLMQRLVDGAFSCAPDTELLALACPCDDLLLVAVRTLGSKCWWMFQVFMKSQSSGINAAFMLSWGIRISGFQFSYFVLCCSPQVFPQDTDSGIYSQEESRISCLPLCMCYRFWWVSCQKLGLYLKCTQKLHAVRENSGHFISKLEQN